jgi:hypothetical protein
VEDSQVNIQSNGHTAVQGIPPVNDFDVPLPTSDEAITAQSILSYVPAINSAREWILSETDVEWMATGCYILGCGGGGSPYSTYLGIREMLRGGAKIRVIELQNMEDDGLCVWGGGIGSPEVSQERLISGEYPEAVSALLDFLKVCSGQW